MPFPPPSPRTRPPRRTRGPGAALLLAGLALGCLGAGRAQEAAPPAAPPAVPVPAPAATPLTLADVLAGLPAAPAWRQADLALEAARRDLDEARAGTGLGLTVGGNLNAGRVFSSDNAGTTNVTGGLSATASANVLPWSPAAEAVRSAERALAVAENQRAATRATLRQTVVSAYFAARLAEADAALAEQTVALRERQLANATAQRAAGTATQETLLARTADLQSAQTALIRARQTLLQNTFSLASTLGRPLANVTFSTPPEAPPEPADPSVLVSRALAVRPEVVSAAAARRNAEAALDAARRARALPDVSATVRYGQLGSGSGSGAGTSVSGSLNLKTGAASASFSPAFGASDGPASLSLGLSASYAILDPAGDAAIASARTRLDTADLALSLARANVELDVRQRLATLSGARAALAASDTLVTAAETALATAVAQQEAGLATATDVLSARLALAQARRDRENALQTAQLALLALQTATGDTP